MTAFRHPEDGYVFIVTYGRSGSTLLQNLLNAIPGYQIRGENNNALFPLFKSWRAITTSPDINRMRQDGEISDASHPWFGAEKIDAEGYCRALCRCFAQTILQPGPDVRVSGFKEIRTIADPARFAGFLRFMQAGFPNARFIFNTRNHDAVVKSAWWRNHDPEEVKTMMRSAETVFRDHAAANPDRAILMRYDDYVADHAAFDPLFELLEARPSAEAVKAVMSARLTHAT